MSNYYNNNKERINAGYMDKEQLFWNVFGVGNEVKVLTAKLPAGLPYEARVKTMNDMKRHVKSLGGKTLRTGFWNVTPYPESMNSSSAELIEDTALPWD